jgi:hypothetical protein
MSLNYRDFRTDLINSEKPSNYIVYLTAVSHWWSDALQWDRVVDIEEQKKGKDVVITLSNGKIVVLQFKIRSKDRDDILIEYRHDFSSGYQKPGWIDLPSAADYLIYCMPGKLYRVEYKTLHSFWSLNKKALIEKYSIPPAKNKDYITRNVAVPVRVLKCYIGVDELKGRNELQDRES